MTILQADLIREMCIYIVDGDHAQFSSAIDRLQRTCDDYVPGLHMHRSDQPASVIADQESVISDLRNQIADLMKDKEASVSASTQIMEALNRTGLRQYHGSLADNVVSVINQCADQEKQIEEDKEHWQKKRAIDTGYRNHANELVLANKEIIESLRHWGLRSNTGSFVSNVTDVIKLCAERGKKIEELNDLRRSDAKEMQDIREVLDRRGLYQSGLGGPAKNVLSVALMCVERGKQIEEFRKAVMDRNDEIEKLTKRIDVMERAAQTRQQFDETDRLLMEKKDKEIESLQERIAVAQGFIQQDREIIAARNTEIADLRKQVSTFTKQVSQRDMTISVLNKEIESLNGGLK